MASADGLWLYPFPAARLGVYAPLRPGQSRVTVPTRASQALAATGARAVLDGSMYTDIGSSGRRVDYLAYDAARGVSIPSSRRDGMTISVVGGEALARVGNEAVPGATVAVQLYPTLIRDGRVVQTAGVDAENVWRAGFGILVDGQVAFALFHGPMHRFAELGLEHGFWHLAYTDGGGSGKMAFDDGQVVGSTEDRAVALWLLDTGMVPASANDAGWWFLSGAAVAYGAWRYLR